MFRQSSDMVSLVDICNHLISGNGILILGGGITSTSYMQNPYKGKSSWASGHLIGMGPNLGTQILSPATLNQVELVQG